MVHFKIPYRHLPLGTRKASNNFSQDRWSPVWYLNMGPPEYEVTVVCTVVWPITILEFSKMRQGNALLKKHSN